MAAHQAPPSLGFSRQEHWSGLPFPSPMHDSEKGKGSRSVVSDSLQPVDYSPPNSSVHGIFQAKVLEWGAIAFSSYRPLEQLKIVRHSSPQELTRHSLLCMVFRGTRWESWMVWEVRRPLMASEMGI